VQVLERIELPQHLARVEVEQQSGARLMMEGNLYGIIAAAQVESERGVPKR
jgi:hypothetical protein